jgi:hypothetical protein
MRMLQDHGVLRTKAVRISARDVWVCRAYTLRLTSSDAFCAFQAACGVCRPSTDYSDGQRSMHAHSVAIYDAAQLTDALACCGLMKYASVACMEDRMRAESMLLNFLGLATEIEVIARAMIEHPLLQNFNSGAPLYAAEPAARRTLWRQVWPRISLSSLQGLPARHVSVHQRLHAMFDSLCAIYIECVRMCCPHADIGGVTLIDGAESALRSPLFTQLHSANPQVIATQP